MENNSKNTTSTFAEKLKLQIRNSTSDLFDQGNGYINNLRLFFGYFNQVPNIKNINNIDLTALRIWMDTEFKDELAVKNFAQGYCEKEKKMIFEDCFFIFKNEIMVNLYYASVVILFKPNQENEAEKLCLSFLKFKLQPLKNQGISFIINSRQGLKTSELELKKPKVNINLHYNNDFKTVHQLVLKTLKTAKTKGLFLFHGLPGTGKSTYIKHLIHQQKKKVIFLSPKLARNLDDLAFTEFLLENPNIILVIEDAEDLIVSRDNVPNSQLSFLLNLTDGLLADSLGIQIIATFNTDLKNIDKALLRKGRLTAIYEFKPLEFEKAVTLAETLKIKNFEYHKQMVLTDIFNYEKTNFSKTKERPLVGFGNN